MTSPETSPDWLPCAANDNVLAAIQNRIEMPLVKIRERTMRVVIVAALVVVWTGLHVSVRRAVPPESRIAALAAEGSK